MYSVSDTVTKVYTVVMSALGLVCVVMYLVPLLEFFNMALPPPTPSPQSPPIPC